MVKRQGYRTAGIALGAGLALSGCVAAVPATQTTLTVIPGQGKTAADLHSDDASCRGTGAVGTTAAAAPTLNAAAVTSEQYYACMASRGEAVIEQQTPIYPTYATYAGYAPYGYPAYAYGYPYAYGGYPYSGYPYYGYGGGYFGPYVGFGVGFGYGGFYGRGYGGRGFGYGGYRGGYGGYRGGYGGFHGGYGGGFHGGGGFHR